MIPINDLKRGFEMYQKEYEQKAKDVLRSGCYVLGSEVSSFESEFSRYMGSKYCIGVDNGLNAIALGIKALDIPCGDEVIVAANTYIATVFGISLNGAVPIFVDITEYHNISPKYIRKAITNKTKAVLVTHLYGQACEMDEIKNICDEYGLYLLEDCAQAHGAEYSGQKVGTFGKMGFFSFYPTKNLGGFGDGGAILTNDSALAYKLKALRNYGSVKRYKNDYEGYNSRLDELQAGFLRVKLCHFPEITAERLRIAELYNNGIRNTKIDLPKIAENCTHVYHLYVIQTDEREKFRNYMYENNIGTDIHYPTPPFLAKPYLYFGLTMSDFPETEKLYRRIISIPIFNGMTDIEINKVIKVVNEYE